MRVTLLTLILLGGMAGAGAAQTPEPGCNLTGLYTYKAKIVRVIDGDTVVAEISLGFAVRTFQRLRLVGIDAPPRGHGGKDKATQHLKARVEGKRLIVKTLKDRRGRYGRYLATLCLDGKNINREMLRKGLARPY